MIRYWLGLAIWGAGLVFIWYLSKGDWQLVSAVATWFLALGVAYAFLQVQQARKSTNAQIAVELFRELRDPKIKETLRFVYDSKPEDLIGLTDDDKKEEISHLLDWYDMLGALTVKGIIDKQLAIKAFPGNSALRCWYKLAKYIRQKQKSRGYYAENYEDFTYRSLESFGKANIKIHIEDDDRDLVKIIMGSPDKELRPRSSKEIKKDRKKNNPRE